MFSGLIIIVFFYLPLSNTPWNLQLYNLQIITKKTEANQPLLLECDGINGW